MRMWEEEYKKLMPGDQVRSSDTGVWLKPEQRSYGMSLESMMISLRTGQVVHFSHLVPWTNYQATLDVENAR